MPRIARGQKKSWGQSLAEFALAIPVFMLVLVGIAEGGYYVVATTIVSHATHEGARYGVLESTSSRAAIRTRVQESAAAVVSLVSTDINLQLNGSAATNAEYQGREQGDRLRVTTTYTHTPLVGYVFDGITFPSNAQAELLVE